MDNKPIFMPKRRWLCSAILSDSVVQPSGFKEPFESGQSRKAIPARMLVVKPPAKSSRVIQHKAKTQNAKKNGL